MQYKLETETGKNTVVEASNLGKAAEMACNWLKWGDCTTLTNKGAEVVVSIKQVDGLEFKKILVTFAKPIKPSKKYE